MSTWTPRKWESKEEQTSRIAKSQFDEHVNQALAVGNSGKKPAPVAAKKRLFRRGK